MSNRPLAALVLLAFGLRAAAALIPFDFSGPDSRTYLEPAAGLASGAGYVDAAGRATAARPPGYPLFIAAITIVAGGPSPLAVRLAQACLGALSVLLIHGAIRALTPADSRLALAAAALVAVDPVAIGQSPYLLREALLLALVATTVWSLTAVPGRWRYLAAGLSLGGLALTHQLYLLLGPFLAMADLARARRRGARALGWRLAAWALAGALVAAPVLVWARRNERVTGRLSFTLAENAVPARELWLTVTCPNVWLNGDPVTGFQQDAWTEEAQLVARLGVQGTKQELYRRAWAEWRDHPLRSAGRTLLQNLWYWAELPGAITLVAHPTLFVVRWVVLPWHWVRLACAAAGLLALRADARLARLVPVATGALLFFALAPALLYPIPRYLAPACPLLDALAAVGLIAALRARAKGAR